MITTVVSLIMVPHISEGIYICKDWDTYETKKELCQRGGGGSDKAVIATPKEVLLSSFVDPRTNADPDPAFYLNADPDPGSQTNADPDPGQTFTSQKVELIHGKYS